MIVIACLAAFFLCSRVAFVGRRAPAGAGRALALLCFLVLFSACQSATSDEERYQTVEKKLMASVSDLTKIPTKVELTNQPYIKGKIAVFQALEKKAAYETGVYLMQPSYFREMKDNYATTPEEVGTVALVNCKTVQKGVYKSDNGREYPAMVEDCDLTMIDRSKAAVVFKKSFEKTPTEDRRVTGNFVVTQSAQSDVLEFLNSLPRR